MNCPASSLGSGLGSGPIPGDQVDQAPLLLSMIKPNYPEVARRHEIQGVVLLQIVVDESGRVEHDVKVIGSISLVDQAAIDVVREWRFAPGHDHDAMVRILLEVRLRFTLRSKSEQNEQICQP